MPSATRTRERYVFSSPGVCLFFWPKLPGLRSFMRFHLAQNVIASSAVDLPTTTVMYVRSRQYGLIVVLDQYAALGEYKVRFITAPPSRLAQGKVRLRLCVRLTRSLLPEYADPLHACKSNTLAVVLNVQPLIPPPHQSGSFVNSLIPTCYACITHTHTQVSFQLQLHTHDDVHERAEAAFMRRKSRRRAKATTAHGSNSSNAAGHHHHHPNQLGGTPGTNHRSSLTTAATAVPGTPHTTASTGGADGDGCAGNANPVESVSTPNRNFDSDRRGGGSGGGSGVSGAPVAAGNTEGAAKDYNGGARPAVPVDPPSSAATASRRRFRRTSTAGG